MPRTVKINRLDAYFSKYIRLRDGYECQRCGKSYSRGDMGLHCSHFIGRANHQTRFDPENCDALCRGCHQFMETHKATVYREWKSDRLGQERFDALIERSQGTRKFDKLNAAEYVKDLLRSVNEGGLA